MSLSPYAQRYAGGFADGNAAKPVDAQYLNAVETTLLGLLGAAVLDKGAQVYDDALGRFKTVLLKNENIDPAAAIAKSKLANLAITDADVAAGANISPSKLNLGTGSVAQALFGDAWAGSAKLLWDTTDAGVVFPTASITTPTLPTAFKHLLVVSHARSAIAAIDDWLTMRFNGISTASAYAWEFLFGNAASATAGTGTDTQIRMSLIPGATATANFFGPVFTLIPFYNNTASMKTAISMGGCPTSTASIFVDIVTGLLSTTTAAVTTLSFQAGANLIAGTDISVYGLG